MHRDLKLGLALAVLLIGSTTAFFFRGDADPSRGLPQLEHPVGLDRKIADGALAPSSEFSSAADAGSGRGGRSPWRKPAFLNGTVTAVSRSVVTPDPIRITIEESAEEIDTPIGVSAVRHPQGQAIEADGKRFHVVQPGDTLSGLAARYLGSIARFDELFELNRDVLEGPHDLKIGMKLRLPGASGTVEAEQSTNMLAVSDIERAHVDAQPESLEVEQESVPLDQPGGPETGPESCDIAPEKLFVPAKRTPFIPSRYRAPRSSAASEVTTTDGGE